MTAPSYRKLAETSLDKAAKILNSAPATGEPSDVSQARQGRYVQLQPVSGREHDYTDDETSHDEGWDGEGHPEDQDEEDD